MSLKSIRPNDSPSKSLPSKLKLAFSKAADHRRISKLFTKEVKSKIDPDDFVVKREKQIFDKTINDGHAAFLYSPDTGEVYTLTMAYHVNEKQGYHKHTEIGTSLASLPGFKSAQIAVAALVLKEWWLSEPNGKIVTEILPENAPSLKLYRDNLNWRPIFNKKITEELHKLCNENIAPEDKGRPTLWFECDAGTLPIMAKILLDYIDQGRLNNKHTGQQIELDLEALQNIGLSRQRIEMIAKGFTSKQALLSKPGAPQP